MKLIVILLVVILVAALGLTIFILHSKVSYLFSKTKHASESISKDLDKKAKLVIKMNTTIKKVLHAKKDYLENLDNLKNDKLTNEEKDSMLLEYDVTIKNLIADYTKLSNHKEIKQQFSDLSDLNEKLDAYKTYFNKYMKQLSSLSTKFPTNFISKFCKVRIETLYQTNEVTKKIDDEL